jgi:hypothetical protein
MNIESRNDWLVETHVNVLVAPVPSV